MAESQAKKDWTKANTTFIGLKLNHNTDADILEALQGKQKQTEIKRLLRIALLIEQPNVATLAAIEEVQRMKADPSISKSYTSVEAMINDLTGAHSDLFKL